MKLSGDARDKRKRAAELQQHLEDCFSNHQCLGGSLESPCSEPPIRSHTIAKRWLKSIARAGHVYAPSYNSLVSQPPLGLPLLGINKASTHGLFCTAHDNILFRPLEADAFSATSKATALLHFRAICRELINKLSAVVLADTMSFSSIDEMGFMMAQRIGLRDLVHHYRREVERVEAQRFEQVRYCVCEFATPLPFAVVGAFPPEIDFDGNALEDLEDVSRTLESVGVACFSDGGKGYCALTWDAASEYAPKLAATFHRIASADKADAALTLCFEFIESVALAPHRWEGLAPSVRQTLLHRLKTAGGPWSPRQQHALTDRPPLLSAHQAVSWRSNDGLFSILR